MCVTVTHLKARSGWEWLRSAQGSDLLRHLQNLVQKHASSPTADPSSDIPLIICGDFNAIPNEEVYRRFITSPLSLDSAYKKLSQDGLTEPEYTTWKIRPSGECCATLDYIWYSRDKLRVDAVLEMPTEEQIGPNRLPSFSYPSDHLSLVCDFSFKEKEWKGGDKSVHKMGRPVEIGSGWLHSANRCADECEWNGEDEDRRPRNRGGRQRSPGTFNGAVAELRCSAAVYLAKL